jgi:hypothetical protein
MTYENDFTLPEEIMEQAVSKGMEYLKDLP